VFPPAEKILYPKQQQQINFVFPIKYIDMKKYLFGLLFTAILVSCKKENAINILKDKIAGTWEIEKIECGLCINPITNFPPGNNNLIIFNTTNVFERKQNNTSVFTGNYSIVSSKECNQSTGDMALLTNENNPSSPLFIQIVNEKLQLSTPYCYADGAITTYRRIQ
jgi:hypothetical protein